MTQSTKTETVPTTVEVAQAISDQELEGATGGFSLGGIVSSVESGVSSAAHWAVNTAENHPFLTAAAVVGTVATGGALLADAGAAAAGGEMEAAGLASRCGSISSIGSRASSVGSMSDISDILGKL